ncbi:unnamed protein product [[Candida] boidinii]|uniref:Unnamed protein product n=1 Tax=Candida boidinii TaxID=5477 RepID=A0ACB5TUR4_CANBO|nr:unnamed protein product [[Candida] boidinii]
MKLFHLATFGLSAMANLAASAAIPETSSVPNVLAKRGHNLVCTDFPTDSLTEGFNVTRTTYKPKELQILGISLDISLLDLIDVDLDLGVGFYEYTGFFYAPEDGDYTLNIPLVHVGADVGFYFGSSAAGIDCCGILSDNHINYLGILLNLDVSLGSKAVGTRQYLTAGYHPIRIVSKQEQTGLGISAEVTLPGGKTESIVPYIKNLPASFVCNSSTSTSTSASKRDDVTLVKKDPIFDTDGDEIQACEGFDPTGLISISLVSSTST